MQEAANTANALENLEKVAPKGMRSGQISPNTGRETKNREASAKDSRLQTGLNSRLKTRMTRLVGQCSF
jgi:hypothetical protein